MTYQSFSSCNPLNTNDTGCSRDFTITIPKGSKYITQDDIYFNIEYTNINYDKINKYYEDLREKCLDLYRGCLCRKIEELREKQTKFNELTESTIKDIEEEEKKAKDRQTPLFIFQNIELFIKSKADDEFKSIARRMYSGLDEMIINGCLYLNQIFPGIKFKYNSCFELMIRFTRAPFINECIKFECHYNLHDRASPNIKGIQLGPPFENSSTNKKYSEMILSGGFSCNVNVSCVHCSFEIKPCVNISLSRIVEPEEWKNKTEELIKKYYEPLKMEFYVDGMKIDKSEFGKTTGLYHIELLNKDELKCDDFYKVDWKIVQLFD